ncbi:MAG: hypothetical protein J6W15_05300 [Clostridia bacterium]|nr:hypothetical protein [Clostridia bacterium]MBO7215965.1 hypothetical protein [Clostridia bacterium]MBO7738531.1 hypothetical protein [Clostridia bacterium]
MNSKQKNKTPLVLFRLILYSMLGALMFVSKEVMEFLPNIHVLGTFILAFTAVYRWGALIPIYVFVILCGIFDGMGPWWVMYLYVWAVLWGVGMLIPKKVYTSRLGYFVFPLVNGLYGFCFGALCAPWEAIIRGFDLKQTLAWISFGFSFDLFHLSGNFAAGFLVVPLAALLIKLERIYNR